ncbi:DUF3224 domain-containing protein [Pseudoalteromonas umbrosa]|uniref:DUF3224 domain-containing protein n=1 Tax=Pseudoalteromonas umbrosa TaxID=3048489 RepID=UPI0024C34A0B|nr:DUF3224 domain-containing protein [Pseudoalteromonas sp. B95]MDK1287930.1 DUF3224 domain-containing protein [Pseudoalteromonas sp. B95]
MTLTGVFHIDDWQESVAIQLEGTAKLNNATIKQSYDGDIKGTSTVHYQLYYDCKGAAIFNGLEVLIHSSNEKNTLVIRHKGQFVDGVASSDFVIIDCDYDKDMIGRTGKFESVEGQKAAYKII